MKRLTIGYQPLSADLSHPGDRRRVVFWAKNRGHEIVTDLSRRVDVILLSEKADLGAFPRKARGVPVIFDLVDAYLERESFAQDWIRGVAKVITGQISGAPKPFTRLVSDLCRNSDAIICSSPEQRAKIEIYSKNVHSILDSHEEFPMLPFRQTQIDDTQRVFWEGMPPTLSGVSQLVNALTRLRQQEEVEMNFVTDPKYFLFLNRFLQKSTVSLLEKSLGNLSQSSRVVPWSSRALVEQAKLADVAVIPIELSSPIQFLKPENRLLIMWRLGLPCVTSASPAYVRVATGAQTDTICVTQEDWYFKLERILRDREQAHDIVQRGQRYLQEFHNRDLLLTKWDNAFESVQ